MRFKRPRKKADTLLAEKKPFFKPGGKAQLKEEPRKPGIKIGSANDKSEKQADATADRVVNRRNQIPTEESAIIQNQETSAFSKASADKEEENSAKSEVQMQEEEETATKSDVQRQEEEEPATKLAVQRQEEEETATKLEVQRQDEEETKAKSLLQKKEEKGNPSPFEDRVKIAKSGGSPLPDKIRNEMEKKLKADFSKVRIHVNDNAIKLCSEIKAQAFISGYHIFFNKGKFNPETSSGIHLLAHELTHFIQQKGR